MRIRRAQASARVHKKMHNRKGKRKQKTKNRSLDKKWDFKACEARESGGNKKQKTEKVQRTRNF
jgi:hypothetical protein